MESANKKEDSQKEDGEGVGQMTTIASPYGIQPSNPFQHAVA